MPRKKTMRRAILAKNVINKKVQPKAKSLAGHMLKVLFKPVEDPQVVVSEGARKRETLTTAATAPITLRSYGNLNRVIAKNVLVSMDIENRRPPGLTEEGVAASLLDVRPRDDLAKKIKSRRLNA